MLALASGEDAELFGDQALISERTFVSFCMKALDARSEHAPTANGTVGALGAALIPFVRAARRDVPLPKDKNAPLQKNTSLANVSTEAASLFKPSASPKRTAKRRAPGAAPTRGNDPSAAALEKFRGEFIKSLCAPIRKQHTAKVKFSMASARFIEVALRKIEADNKRAKDKDGDGRISWMERYGDAANAAVDLDTFVFTIEECTGVEKPADEERREALLTALFDLVPSDESNVEHAQELRLAENFSSEYNRPEESGAFVLREMDMARFLSVPFEMLRRALVPEFVEGQNTIFLPVPPSEGLDRNTAAVSVLPLLQRARLLYHAAVVRCTLKIGFNREVPKLTGREVVQDIMDSRRAKEEEKRKAMRVEIMKEKRDEARRRNAVPLQTSSVKIPTVPTGGAVHQDEDDVTYEDAVDVDENVLDATLTSKSEAGDNDEADGDENEELFAQSSQGMGVMGGDESTPSGEGGGEEEELDNQFAQEMADGGDESAPPSDPKEESAVPVPVVNPEEDAPETTGKPQLTAAARLAAALERLDAIRMAEYALSRAEHMLLMPEVVLPLGGGPNDVERESRARILRLRHAGLGSALDDAAVALTEADTVPTRPIVGTWSTAFEEADRKHAARDQKRMEQRERDRQARADTFMDIGGGVLPTTTTENAGTAAATKVWNHIPGEMWTLDVPKDPSHRVTMAKTRVQDSQKSHTLSGPIPHPHQHGLARAAAASSLLLSTAGSGAANPPLSDVAVPETSGTNTAVDDAAAAVDDAAAALRTARAVTRGAVASARSAEEAQRSSGAGAADAYRIKLMLRSRTSFQSAAQSKEEGAWEEHKGTENMMNGGKTYFVHTETGAFSDVKPQDLSKKADETAAEMAEADAAYDAAVVVAKAAQSDVKAAKEALREARRGEAAARGELEEAEDWLREETASALPEEASDGRDGLPLPPPAAMQAWATSNIADQKQKKKKKGKKGGGADGDGEAAMRSHGLDVKENLVMWEEEMRSAVKSIAREDDAAALWAARVRVLASKKLV